MRKVQFSTFDGVLYSGYTLVTCDSNNMSKTYHDIPDNSCDEIVAYDFICHFTIGQVQELFVNIVKKLRKGGTLSFDFLNFQALDIASFTDEDFNSTIFRCKACYSTDYLLNLLNVLGLEVITIETKQGTCETTVTTKRR